MKGDMMNFMIGLFIALVLLLVLGTLFTTQLTDAGNAVEGCSPLASLISDASSGSIQPC